MTKTSTQIVKNTVTGWGALLIQFTIALFMVPFLFAELGVEGYGLIGLLAVMLSMSRLVDLGLRNALSRELAEKVARGDRDGFNELANTTLVLYLMIGCLLSLACLLGAPGLAAFFKVPESMLPIAIPAIRIYGGVSFLLSFITPVFSASMTSHNRFDTFNSIRISVSAFCSILIFVFLSVTEWALYGWVGIKLLNQVLELIVLRIYCRKITPQLRFGFKWIRRRRLKPLFQLGSYIYALQMTNTLSEHSDPLVISFFRGPAGVALYNPGTQVAKAIRPLVLMLINQLHPLATKQHVDQNQEKQQQILIKGTHYTMLMGSLFCVGMGVFAEPFCRLWLMDSLGADYQLVVKIMMGWAIADFLMYTGGSQWPVLLGMKRLGFLICVQMPLAMVNLGLSIYLVGHTRLGILGVLVATISVGLIRRPITTWFAARACGITTRTYVQKAYLRPFLLTAVLLPLAIGFRMAIPQTHFLWVGLSAVLTGLVWMGLTALFGVDKQERKWIFDRLKSSIVQIKSG